MSVEVVWILARDGITKVQIKPSRAFVIITIRSKM